MKAISGKEMCRILAKKGWRLVRVRGSHHNYEHDDAPAATVPVHANRTMPIGLQSAIMKIAGLTENDL